MQAILFVLTYTLDPGVGSKEFFFLKVVMLHIKLKEMKRTIKCKQIVCLYKHPLPWMGFKGQTIFPSDRISNEQEGWSCTYHDQLYHVWVCW